VEGAAVGIACVATTAVAETAAGSRVIGVGAGVTPAGVETSTVGAEVACTASVAADVGSSAGVDSSAGVGNSTGVKAGRSDVVATAITAAGVPACAGRVAVGVTAAGGCGGSILTAGPVAGLVEAVDAVAAGWITRAGRVWVATGGSVFAATAVGGDTVGGWDVAVGSSSTRSKRAQRSGKRTNT
jgi:hypothetical protein